MQKVDGSEEHGEIPRGIIKKIVEQEQQLLPWLTIDIIYSFWKRREKEQAIQAHTRWGPDPGGSQSGIFITARKYTTHLLFFIFFYRSRN